MDIVITLDKAKPWEFWRDRITLGCGAGACNCYLIDRVPRNLNHGDRLYIVWHDLILGWQAVERVSGNLAENVSAETVVRLTCTGPFHVVAPRRMNDFTGFKYINRSEVIDIERF